jgi:hypothetical protein
MDKAAVSRAQSNKVDDVQFTRDMIKFLAASTCVDPKRIYASGCSNGGGMSYMLACKAADVIAAVAPVDFRCITGAEPANASSLTPTNNTACTCTLPRPISVTAFDEGQDNSIVPYNGGQTVVAADCPPGGSCKAFNFPGAQVNVDTCALRHVQRLGEHALQQLDLQDLHVVRRQYRGHPVHGAQRQSLRQLQPGQDRRHVLGSVPEGISSLTAGPEARPSRGSRSRDKGVGLATNNSARSHAISVPQG